MFCLYMFFLSLYRDHRDLHVLTHSFPTRRSSDRVHPVTAREPLQERLQPRAFAPSPSKAGEGWGGVSSGSARTVGTPSQPSPAFAGGGAKRSEEHTSELQSLMRISYAVFCLKKKTTLSNHNEKHKTNKHYI